MKPTDAMMRSVMQNQDLMKGFDNPQVMEAVNDIAKNPENIKKYKNNPQVMQFYQSMAGTMASRFEQLAKEEEATNMTKKNDRNGTEKTPESMPGAGKSALEEKLFVVNERKEKKKDDAVFKPLIEEL